MDSYMHKKWGNVGYSERGAANAKWSIREREPEKPWLNMKPIKRYKYFTRYYKKCINGNGYYVCFLNTDIDRKETELEQDI